MVERDNEPALIRFKHFRDFGFVLILSILFSLLSYTYIIIQEFTKESHTFIKEFISSQINQVVVQIHCFLGNKTKSCGLSDFMVSLEGVLQEISRALASKAARKDFESKLSDLGDACVLPKDIWKMVFFRETF